MPLTTEAELRRALDDGLMSGVLTYDQDKRTRFISSSQPRVAEYTINRDVNLVPQGCVMAIFAEEDSPQLQAIYDALADEKSSVIRDVALKLRDSSIKRTVVPAIKAAQSIISQPAYAELYYGNMFLAGGAFAPEDTDLSCILLPYTGGELDDGQFSLVTYKREEHTRDLNALILKRTPDLTSAEKAALAQVGSEFHIGPADLASIGFCTPAALFACVTAGVIVAGVGVGAWYYLHHGATQPRDLRVSEENIARLGPTASARELLAARRRILIGQY